MEVSSNLVSIPYNLCEHFIILSISIEKFSFTFSNSSIRTHPKWSSVIQCRDTCSEILWYESSHNVACMNK